MCSQMHEILEIKQFFETVNRDTSVEKVREMGLCLLSIIDEKIQHIELLKDKLLEANDDLYWLRKRADDWMLRAMENSQTKRND